MLESHLSRHDDGGQKPYEIRPDTIIDFTAVTKWPEAWPKSNDFGQFHYRKKTANNACNPNMALVRDFVRRELTARGLVADIAWHSGAARDGGENIHAHILFPTRPVEGEGFGKKDRELERKATLQHWRQAWAMHVNRTLEAAGIAARIDHRSLAGQGVDRLPENLGRSSIALEQRGIETGQGDRWRDIRHCNKVTRHARPELTRAIAAEAEELEMLSAAQRRTHALLMLARRTYT